MRSITMSRVRLSGALALGALGAASGFTPGAATADAAPSASTTSTVSDPVGDTYMPFSKALPFQDIVRGRMTKTASGDFELLMEVAGAVPAAPPLPPPSVNQVWWVWSFDLDTSASPRGYPVAPGKPVDSEFIVVVSWDGAKFAGTAVDRRPLLTGGHAIVTPVPFSVNGSVLQAFLRSGLIGEVAPSFVWRLRVTGWSSPVGGEGVSVIDDAETVFNP